MELGSARTRGFAEPTSAQSLTLAEPGTSKPVLTAVTCLYVITAQDDGKTLRSRLPPDPVSARPEEPHVPIRRWLNARAAIRKADEADMNEIVPDDRARQGMSGRPVLGVLIGALLLIAVALTGYLLWV